VSDDGTTIYTITPEVTGVNNSQGAITPQGPQSLKVGDSITYSITPAKGYHTKDVLVNGVSVGPVSNYQMLVTGNMSIKAVFDITSVQLNSTGSSGKTTTGDTLKMTVSLGDSQMNAQAADWFAVMYGPGGKWSSYDAVSGLWKDGLSVSYQGPLMTIDSFDILSAKGLHSGDYAFCFGVDTEQNGVPDMGSLHYDCKNITVSGSTDKSSKGPSLKSGGIGFGIKKR
jgi:hypothetical protein